MPSSILGRHFCYSDFSEVSLSPPRKFSLKALSHIQMKRIRRGSGGWMRTICASMSCVFCLLLFTAFDGYSQSSASASATFAATPILSRPTDNSITVTIVPSDSAQVYFEFGAKQSSYPRQTAARSVSANIPQTFVLDSVKQNTRYYYRMRSKVVGGAQFQTGDEHTFQTQRPTGSTFTFTIEADPHPYDKKGSHTLWPITMANQLADSADFLIDLGDTFGDDHNPFTITSAELRQLHLDSRGYFGLVCHSSPLFFCLGNHEGESGYYLLQTPPANLGVYGTLWRKYYYANPIPDGFYSGNATAEDFGMGLPENYYAWEWGDALFVVVDAYRYYTANAKPRGWDWTIGKVQYDWLKQTLENSKAKFKFVITHHVLGETRGGVIPGMLYEWGGYEADGKTWGFSTNRPGWPMPIHQLMVKNGVTIYFQGHDHLFAREEMDGVVYQEVPMPSDSTYLIGVTDNGDAYSGIIVDGSGHLRVTVSPESVKVDYVQAWLPKDENATRRNRQVAYSYAVRAKTTSVSQAAVIPEKTALEQNYPNPFNPVSDIRYQVSDFGYVRLAVYDPLGRKVETLVDRQESAGSHVVTWDASHLPSGVYFYRLQANGYRETRKAILLK
jgi:hypothetical protein